MKRISLYLALCALALGQAFGAPRKLTPQKRPSIRPEQRFVPGAYIVELNGDSVASAVTKSAGLQIRHLSDHQSLVTQHRTRVAREQSLMRPTLEAKGAKVHHSVDVVMNAMMVKYAGKREDLQALSGVKHVYPVRRFKKNLDRAVAITQVSDLWNQIGGAANAGAGMKIGILDEGIDIIHPGFKDTGFQAPPGYPKSDTAADLQYTNNKVIVARSYAEMISQEVDGYSDYDPTVQDHSGHGTALAMVAAGVTNTGPFGTITGVAPGAYLGIYRIWNTLDDTTTEDADIAALNDAVADGMDVINMSFGSIYATRFDQDPLVAAVEAAYQAGVIVVISSGNSGPYFTTVGSPATAPHAISVGASTNDRAFGPAVWSSYTGTLGGWDFSGGGLLFNTDGPTPSTPLTAPLVDAATLGNPIGCDPFDSSVSGKIVAIARGTCTFELKVSNAQAAGAVAVLITDTQADTDAGNLSYSPLSHFTIGAATLPSQLVDFYTGQYITQWLAYNPFDLTMSFNLCGDASYFTPCAFNVTPNLLAGFSSAGPGVDLGIKPEILAPGENLSMATQSFDQNGDLYDSSGYMVADGTSFSSPFTAGVAAMIKAARPGLTTDQYRSLIINTAKSTLDPRGNPLSTQQTGVGVINALNAYNSPVVASPVTLGLGTSAGSPQISQTVTLTNIGTVDDSYALSASSADGVLQPIFSGGGVTVPAGQSQTFGVVFSASGLAPGAYQGSIVAASSATGAQIRIPYWLDVPSTDPSNLLVVYVDPNYEFRNGAVLDAFEFRLTDSAGAPMTSVQPRVTVVSGGGSVTAVNSADAPNANISVGGGYIVQDIPGLWTVDVVLGPATGDNVFRVTAGSLTQDFVITGCRAITFFGTCQ